jgi:hypothetical protein
MEQPQDHDTMHDECLKRQPPKNTKPLYQRILHVISWPIRTTNAYRNITTPEDISKRPKKASWIEIISEFGRRSGPP